MQQTALMTVRLLLLVSQLVAGCLGQYSIGNGRIAPGLGYNGEMGPPSSPMGWGIGYRPDYGDGYGYGLGYGGSYEIASGYGPGPGYGTMYGAQGLGYAGGFNPVPGYGTASATGFAGGYGAMGLGLGHNGGTGYPTDFPSYPYTSIPPAIITGPAIVPAQSQLQSSSNRNTNTNTNTNINISNRMGKRHRGSLTRELLGLPQL